MERVFYGALEAAEGLEYPTPEVTLSLSLSFSPPPPMVKTSPSLKTQTYISRFNVITHVHKNANMKAAQRQKCTPSTEKVNLHTKTSCIWATIKCFHLRKKKKAADTIKIVGHPCYLKVRLAWEQGLIQDTLCPNHEVPWERRFLTHRGLKLLLKMPQWHRETASVITCQKKTLVSK